MRLHPGETEAVGWRVVILLDAVQQLRDTSPEVTSRARMIAIDGRGGAGKTTPAERLHTAIPPSATVQTDDVAWNHAYFDGGAVLTDDVLRPLHRPFMVREQPGTRATMIVAGPAHIAHNAGIEVVVAPPTSPR